MTGGGRRWLEVRVRSPALGERSAVLADALVGLGARGVEERVGWFIAWFEEPADPEHFLDVLPRALSRESRLDRIQVEHSWQEHEDWAETWKRGLSCRRVTDRIVVHPSWLVPEGVRPEDIVIELDPGMAFGTAEHGTTRGCLRLLDGLVHEGDQLLDLGAGSGILAIAAARLGATSVVAIEGDSLACEAMRENIDRNGMSGRVRVVEDRATTQSIAEMGPVSGIVANIEAGLLRPLFDGCAAALPAGTWLIVSGILDDEWEWVEEEIRARGFVLRTVDADDEWRSGLFDRVQAGHLQPGHL
jgi:ribosomal protein L11 methyltransferase